MPLLLLCFACDGAAGPEDDDAPERSLAPDEMRDEPRDSRAVILPPRPGEPADVGADMDGGVDEDAGVDAERDCGEGARCSLFAEGSCAAGEQCKFVIEAQGGSPAPTCTAAGEGAEGEACMGYADCGDGLDCTAEGAPGVCRGYCCAVNSTEGCPSGQFCKIALQDGSGAMTDTFLCDACDGCDLLGGGDCGRGLGCYPLSADGCRACLPVGDRGAADTCGYANECMAGSGCFATPEGPARCRAYCDLDGRDSCPEGTACHRVSGVALGARVGLCFPD